VDSARLDVGVAQQKVRTEVQVGHLAVAALQHPFHVTQGITRVKMGPLAKLRHERVVGPKLGQHLAKPRGVCSHIGRHPADKVFGEQASADVKRVNSSFGTSQSERFVAARRQVPQSG
jgi:hypothetical protein